MNGGVLLGLGSKTSRSAASSLSGTRNLTAFNRRYYLQSGLSQCAVYNKTTAHGGLAHFSSFTQPKPSKGVY